MKDGKSREGWTKGMFFFESSSVSLLPFVAAMHGVLHPDPVVAMFYCTALRKQRQIAVSRGHVLSMGSPSGLVKMVFVRVSVCKD